MVTCDFSFITNHHTTGVVLNPHEFVCFASFRVNVYMYFDEVICISGLFANNILTYNSSDRLGDFVGATLLLLWMSLPTVASRQFVQ